MSECCCSHPKEDHKDGQGHCLGCRNMDDRTEDDKIEWDAEIEDTGNPGELGWCNRYLPVSDED